MQQVKTGSLADRIGATSPGAEELGAPMTAKQFSKGLKH